MENNQIFYHFLHNVVPEQEKQFKKTKQGYETYRPLDEAGIKVSFYEKDRSILVTRQDKEYKGGEYANTKTETVYKVEELSDRLRFIPLETT